MLKVVKGLRVLAVADDDNEQLAANIAERRARKDAEMRASLPNIRTFRLYVRPMKETEPGSGIFVADNEHWRQIVVEAHGYTIHASGDLAFERAVYLGNPMLGIMGTYPLALGRGQWHSVLEISEAFQPRVN